MSHCPSYASKDIQGQPCQCECDDRKLFWRSGRGPARVIALEDVRAVHLADFRRAGRGPRAGRILLLALADGGRLELTDQDDGSGVGFGPWVRCLLERLHRAGGQRDWFVGHPQQEQLRRIVPAAALLGGVIASVVLGFVAASEPGLELLWYVIPVVLLVDGVAALILHRVMTARLALRPFDPGQPPADILDDHPAA